MAVTGTVATHSARAQSDPPAASAPPATLATAGILTYSQALTPDAIRLIQTRLRDAGAFQGVMDGAWTGDSQQALRSFQQTRGLQVTGQINQATAVTLGINPLDLIGAGGANPAPGVSAPSAAAPGLLAPAPSANAAAAPSPSSPPAAAPRAPIPLSRVALQLIQTRLREGGYYNGATDGVWGPASQAALIRLQQTRSLPPTGRIDGASVQALGFDPSSFPPR